MPKSSLPLVISKFSLRKYLTLLAISVFATFNSSSIVHGQSFNLVDDLGGILSLEGVTATGIGQTDGSFLDIRPVAQLAFAPGVDDKVYIATSRNGIWRFDYDPTSSNPLTNGIVAVPTSITTFNSVVLGSDGLPTNGSLGLAFHTDSNGLTSMYFAPSVGFRGSRDFDNEAADYGIVSQSIFRVTDNNGDGLFGFDGDQSLAIVDNVRVTTLHQIDQLAVRGDSLFVSIGSNTENGGIVNNESGNQRFPGESQYSGTLSYIEDLNAVGSGVNAAGFDFVDSGPANFNARDLNNDGELNEFELNDAAARTDTQAFTSTDISKLRIFSTGFRNGFGLGIRSDGAVFVSENEENGTGRPDELFQTSFQANHGFPKANDIFDFRTNSALQAIGFFDGIQTGFGVGLSTSAGGLAFLGADAGDFAGDVMVSRFVPGDVLLVDPITGQSRIIVGRDSNGQGRVTQGLDIAEDPFGNYLITDGAGTIQVLAVNSISTPEPEPEPEPGPEFANPAADYVASLASVDAAPTALPNGWTYLFSDEPTGGTETELTIVPGIGNANNTGFGQNGAFFDLPAVLGNHDISDQFEIFDRWIRWRRSFCHIR